jgi:adenylylsulfate kinase
MNERGWLKFGESEVVFYYLGEGAGSKWPKTSVIGFLEGTPRSDLRLPIADLYLCRVVSNEGNDLDNYFGSLISMTQRGVTVWLTGLSGAGKTTITHALEQRLRGESYSLEVLDGDVVRTNLTKGLGFSKADRDENIRRIGFVANLLTRNGVIVLVSAISPYRQIREEVRGKIGDFVEVFVNAPLDVCEGRDVKGLYKRARSGEIQGFTGIDDPYEPPANPEVECRTDLETLEESVDKVWLKLTDMGYLASRVLA